jgi:D-threo-aldose 1-dehydrogenase
MSIKPAELVPLGRTKIRVPRIGFGGAPLGNLFARIDENDAQGALNAAYDAGLRYFDTAPLYGHGLSETRMGAALSQRPRDSFVLSTKTGRLLRRVAGTRIDGDGYVEMPPYEAVYDYSYDGTMRSVEQSLERLKLSRIDILFIHDIDGWTHGDVQPQRYREAIQGAFPALDKLRSEGTVGAIGVGVNEWQVTERAARDADFDCFLLAGRYTLLEQDALSSFLPLCVSRKIGIVIGGAYNSGILATGPVDGAVYNYKPAPPEIKKRVAQIEAVCRRHNVPLAAAALQFPLHHPAVATVIPGARTPGEVAANLKLLATDIPDALWHELKRERLMREDAPVPGNR